MEKVDYLISKDDVLWSDNRWMYKGGRGQAPKRRAGYIGLFDRNRGHFIWFKIVRKAEDSLGWVCQRRRVVGYWSKLMLGKG